MTKRPLIPTRLLQERRIRHQTGATGPQARILAEFIYGVRTC